MTKILTLSGLALLAALTTGLPATAAEVHLFVRHEVNDYAAWRKAFDAFRPESKKLGAVTAAVYQSVDNPNDVTVTHDFKSGDQAKAFAASPQLKEAMGKAGVKGVPQIWFATRSK
jgi:quinol monooxygenase YgiN